ncbi:chemotaxis protein [candidate division KSB3 bacterium]|uniref:protein-glutamate O-methyltransferase n=1 Tax=candidate division KSB3 bacterium TaxID=2044937 RepID=A0A2G6E9S9_9BACT|nr:MAG: chemotaxis protein [candidate division KSB3 bacterium]
MTLQQQQDFEIIRDLIWEKSGIYFENTKRQYCLRRLQNRMILRGCRGLKEYYHILQYESSGAELSELLNLLTTTETYFFRNTPQLRSFQEEILPDILRRKQQNGEAHLHFWSAGCSSGEEAYTIAMLLLETLPENHAWKISIAGTDINTDVLIKAREAVYSGRALRDTPETYIHKYFQKEGDLYRLSDRVKNMVRFRKGNLIQSDDASLLQSLDCIFCRNVLIYFNLESCRQVIEIFYNNLARHGYLLLGHSESLYRITAIFALKKLQHSLVYYKE